MSRPSSLRSVTTKLTYRVWTGVWVRSVDTISIGDLPSSLGLGVKLQPRHRLPIRTTAEFQGENQILVLKRRSHATDDCSGVSGGTDTIGSGRRLLARRDTPLPSPGTQVHSSLITFVPHVPSTDDKDGNTVKRPPGLAERGPVSPPLVPLVAPRVGASHTGPVCSVPLTCDSKE